MGRHRVFARGLACTLAAAALLLPAAAVAQPLEISGGEILVGVDSDLPPPDTAAWQPVMLPDVWLKSRPGVRGHAWYRMHFDLPSRLEGRQVVYFERLRTVGAAFLNGRQVGQYGDFGVANRTVRPQMFDLPPDALREGRNTLHVRLWVAPGFAGALAPVRIGPRAPFVAAIERENFLNIALSQFVAVIGTVLGAMMLVIWLGRRHDTMFGWFALAALSKALYVTLNLGAIPGMPSGTPVAILAAPMLAPLSIYCLRYAGWRWPRFEALLWIAGIVYGLHHAAWIVFGTGLPYGTWFPLWLFLLAAPLVLTVVIMFHRPGAESALLVLAHLYALGTLLYNFYYRPIGGIDFDKTHTLPLFLVMAWILTRRFVQSLNEAEALNANLERRVAEKAAELERNAARTQQLARDAAVAAERQRMMSDMHDGIGGQLISTLALVEGGEASGEQVAAALRESIDDLRLAIDSLEPTNEDLLPVLGNLRYRLEPRLKARGIELDWQVKDVPKLACLTPQNVLHVLRVLQEAFTNVLRHARAKHIRVSTRSESGRVLIDVSDDGVGMPGEDRPGGHGLANMRRRMAALGGDLLFLPSNKGTTVTLSLPEGQLQPA